jgi:hypothetical protein
MRIATLGLVVLLFGGCQQKDQRQAPEPTARAFEPRSSEPRAAIDAAPPAARLLAFRFDQGWGPCDARKRACRTLLRITSDCQMDEEHDNHPSHATLDKARCAPLLDLARDQIAPLLRAPDTCGKTHDVWENVTLDTRATAARRSPAT